MQCPVCNGINLVMSERSGVEIDYCPQCRGVWLDRGELDKIIERSSIQNDMDYRRDSRGDDRRDERVDYKHNFNAQNKHYPHKKKESFLSDLFDF